MRRILIATEDSPCSAEAVRQYVKTIGGGPAEVYVLTVIPPLAGFHSAEQAQQDLEASLRSADHALNAAALELAAAGITVRAIRRVGPPAATILAVARELSVGLIVLGTNGAGAPPPATCTSVAEAVLHEAPCGVVIFPWRTPATARA